MYYMISSFFHLILNDTESIPPNIFAFECISESKSVVAFEFFANSYSPSHYNKCISISCNFNFDAKKEANKSKG